MRDVLYLAWRYLAFHRIKTGILVASIMLIVYLPVGLDALVDQSATQLTARAEATPLLVGAKGSPLELVLSSLYFRAETPAPLRYSAATRITESGLATPIPLYVRFRSGKHPIVGTGIEYFDFRGLALAAGRPMAVLGECVVGAAAATALGVAPGDSVVSSPESVFDLAGVYPLKMHVVGVLAPSLTPDDTAIFVDVKTAWIIEGLGHGHQDLSGPGSSSAVLGRDANTIIANASVRQYNEVTAENRDSFHFHGEGNEYPISAVLAVPHDTRSGVILMGRYEGPEQTSQIVRPKLVMGELLDTVLTVRHFLIAATVVVGLATLSTAALVFMLSIRLRKREIATMLKLGGARAHVTGILLAEVVVVMFLGTGLAAVLTALTRRFGPAVIEGMFLS